MNKNKSAPAKQSSLVLRAVLAAIGFLLSPWLIDMSTPASCRGHGSHRTKVSVVQADLRSMSAAIEKYFIKHDSYPASAAGPDGVNEFAPANKLSYQISTFRRATDAPDSVHTLTTPVAFISEYVRDNFADYGRATFAYYSDGNSWIMWSPGPDGDYDIDPDDYTPGNHPSPILIGKTYDPTNGSVGSGDIWVARE